MIRLFSGFDAGSDREEIESALPKGSSGGGGGHGRDIYVCAEVTGNTAIVIHEAVYAGSSDLCISRRGTIPVDGTSGEMIGLQEANGCSFGDNSVPATLVTSGNSLIYTLRRSEVQDEKGLNVGDLIITLNLVDACLSPS